MMYTALMAEAIIRLVLRLPSDLHAALAAWAKDEDRSLNAQIVRVLRQAVESRGR